MKTFFCEVCEEPATVGIGDAQGQPRGRCANHLPQDARALYDALREAGWHAPPAKSVH